VVPFKAIAKLILKVGIAPISSGSHGAINKAGLVPVIFLMMGYLTHDE